MAEKKDKRSKQTEVFSKKPVKKNHALDERRRRSVVHDVCDRKGDAGRECGISICMSLSCFGYSFYEKLRVAKRIPVEKGVVIGYGDSESCCVCDGGISLFGFHAGYFSKFETPGWYPKTRLDLAMTGVFAEAMIGSNAGKAWFGHQRMYRWNSIKSGE